MPGLISGPTTGLTTKSTTGPTTRGDHPFYPAVCSLS